MDMRRNKYSYMYACICMPICVYIDMYMYMVTRSAAPPHPPQMVWEAPPSVVWVAVGFIGNPPPSFSPCALGSGGWESLPPSPPVVWRVVGGNPPSSFASVVWGLVGGNPPPSFFSVVWGLVGGSPPPSPCGVGFRAGKSWCARSGREASLVRQTILCGRRFCSETLGCPFNPFKCFGRPWRFLLGTIQYRAINSVRMTSRPPTIDYTRYTLEFLLYSVYMVYLYMIARPFQGGNQVLHTSLRAMWEPDYSILQHTTAQRRPEAPKLQEVLYTVESGKL